MFGKRKNPVKKHMEDYGTNDSPNRESSASKIVFGEVFDSDNDNAKYVDSLKMGKPICLNFENVEVKEANKILAFMIGATYALGGKTIEIGKKVYLFVLKPQLEDGSINNWLLQFKH